MSTKEQERKALAQIRKIVDSLGTDSYLSYAFDGCFEIAENNIADDFATSPREMIEARDARIKELEKKLADAEERKAQLETSVKAWKAVAISLSDMNDMRRGLGKDRKRYQEDLQAADSEILEYCTEPGSDLFRKAVQRRETCQKSIARIDELVTALNNSIQARCEIK